MTTPRATRTIVRLSPLLAWLVVSAFATPRAEAAGCAHPATAPATSSAGASLSLLDIADEAGTSWTPPGAPCHGPRCRSKAPAADAPGALVAAPDRHQAIADATAFPPPPSSIALTPGEPRLVPVLAASRLERPPRIA
ncbi:hypothetical protein [Paludisphaera sp.]|uniref:hypothetical protein n=1 Tax=Paludisphaera sp. TaxID=2017432 RepID=UPI00301C0DA1